MNKVLSIVCPAWFGKTGRSLASQYIRPLRGADFKILKFAMVLFLFLSALLSEAQDYLVGVRGGASFESGAGYFRQTDVFVGRYLPWQWDSYFGLSFKPRVEASLGWLDGGSKDGVVGTAGPVIELREGKFPVTLEGGVSLTGLSRYDFEEKDLGGWFQFTDHVGLDWHITKCFTVGWRYQHMSNAGIYRCNPGLNLQVLSVSYRF
jgi:Lipid A 3-O-deacylase (PagL)